MTSKGKRSVFIDEVEILISESTYLDKVDELLIKAGSDREHILSATIFLIFMADFTFTSQLF